MSAVTNRGAPTAPMQVSHLKANQDDITNVKASTYVQPHLNRRVLISLQANLVNLAVAGDRVLSEGEEESEVVEGRLQLIADKSYVNKGKMLAQIENLGYRMEFMNNYRRVVNQLKDNF